MKSSTQRLPYLESSRGIAAFVVMLAHFQRTMLPGINDSALAKSPLHVLIDGEAAVLYFFILSGYVLTLSLRKTESINIRSFFKFVLQRIFRIYPAFLLTLLITFVIIHIPYLRPSTWLDQFWNHTTGFFSLLKQSLLLIRIPYQAELRLIPQDWTLTIELAISILMPILSMLFRKGSVFVLIIVFYSVQFLGLDPFVFDFTLGVFIAHNQVKILSIMNKISTKVVAVVIALFCLSLNLLFSESIEIINTVLINLKSWGVALLLCLILSSSLIQNILSFRLLSFFGKISYSFYLLHLIILFSMTIFFNGQDLLMFALIYLLITIIASTFSYLLVEKPFNRLGKSILNSHQNIR